MSATTETVTMEQWRDHVLANSENSYDLVHCAAALFLAEYGAEDESDWDAKMADAFPAMTGFQAGNATSIARQVWPLFADARREAIANHEATDKWLRQSIEDGTMLVYGGKDEDVTEEDTA